MVILWKSCKPDNFESYNSLKLSFRNIWGLLLIFLDCESFLESNSLDIFAVCETNLDDLIDSGNFSERDYLPLIQKDSSTHMHGLAVDLRERLPFAQKLSLENSADSYLCFRLALLHWVSYFFFLYQSRSSSLCKFLILFHLTKMRFSWSTDLLMCLSLETLTSIIRTDLHIPVELIDLVNSVQLRWLTFLRGSQTVILTVLLFWISFFLLTLLFVLKWLWLHREILIMLWSQFPLTFHHIQWDVPFHCIAYDYFRADWDGLHDHLRDVEDIFKISASAASELCAWVQVRIDVYITHRKY